MKAKHGCWTCKQRKISCDKGLPSCNNCKRTSRECLGYGIRLLWPDQHDGRRKDTGFIVYEPPENPSEFSQTYGQHFLNVTFRDVTPVRTAGTSSFSGILPQRPVQGPARTLTLHPSMIGQDAMFMSYYETVITSMISTTQVQNGFRTDLMQMALSRRDMAAQALWNSMMAVAAIHHSESAAALIYTTRAVRYLSASLCPRQNTGSIQLNETQFATCMMLCTYSVFDETDSHWLTHLNGAKYMLQKIFPDHRKQIKADFLFTWFLYHEVLACFAQPLRQANNCIDVLLILKTSDCNSNLILGALGCSLETIAIIHRVNKFRIALIRNEVDLKSYQLLLDRSQLEDTLTTLFQSLGPNEKAGETPARHTCILAIAELWRIGALLYLLHVVPLRGDETKRATYLNQAFSILERLEVATSPWPVFMVACECHTDEQRIQILQIMDLMDKVRNIGNIRVMRHLIETCWKRYDLQADSNPPHLAKWWEFANYYETAVPWFI